MAGVAALIGLPLFFEVGVVLLVPIVLLVARRTDVPLLRIGIPALAGLSVLHGLVPPHPGPLVAIASLNADLGLTLLFGLICAIPTVIIAGPVFGNFIARYVPATVPARCCRPGVPRGRRPRGDAGPARTADADRSPVADDDGDDRESTGRRRRRGRRLGPDRRAAAPASGRPC